MPKKRFSAEQIVTLLRQIEVAMGQGKSTQIACREAGISEQVFFSMDGSPVARRFRSDLRGHSRNPPLGTG